MNTGESQAEQSDEFVGLGEAVLSPAAISLISDYFPPARRGTAVGCSMVGLAWLMTAC